MILSVKSLKAFKSASSFIKPNGLIPVLAYIKFGAGTITKNNLNAFLVADMPGAEPMLVEELSLWKAVDNASGDTIELTRTDNTITIGKAKHQTITDAFPDNATPSGPAIPIDSILPDIAICSALVSTEELETKFHFVHVNNKSVGATDKIVMYYNTHPDDLPSMILRKEVAQTVSRLNGVSFSENDSYQFFTVPGMLYGFIKPEGKDFDLTQYFKLPVNAPSLVLNKSDIVAFSNYIIGYTPAALFWTDLVVDGPVTLGFNDTDWKKSYSTDVDATITGEHPPIRWNAVLMQRLLNVLPDEQITMYRAKDQYYITGSSGYVALIQGAGIL